MQIIFSRQAAEELQDRYTILELETFDVQGQKLEAFCVVPTEKIGLQEMQFLDNYKKLHAELINHLKQKNYKVCEDLIEHLMGKFGGELDSFYTIILERCKSTETS